MLLSFKWMALQNIRKFQLVHPGKLAENQVTGSQNLLIADEWTSVEIFAEDSRPRQKKIY